MQSSAESQPPNDPQDFGRSAGQLTAARDDDPGPDDASLAALPVPLDEASHGTEVAGRDSPLLKEVPDTPLDVATREPEETPPCDVVAPRDADALLPTARELDGPNDDDGDPSTGAAAAG